MVPPHASKPWRHIFRNNRSDDFHHISGDGAALAIGSNADFAFRRDMRRVYWSLSVASAVDG